MRRMRLTLGYRGTRYAGWATQPASTNRGPPTVQATLETALSQSLGHSVRTTAAGRTDSGVHADGQVVSLDTSSSMPAAGLQRVLERWLPSDIWVMDAQEATPEFDARRSAVRRWYRYAIWREGVPPAGWQGRCLPTEQPLDIAAMREASSGLLGRHDFGAFAARPVGSGSTQRTVFAADWLRLTSSLLIFEICADAYLKQMVRSIVGSLIWVGSARWTPQQFRDAAGSGDRRTAGPKAPATGLTLHRIEY